MANGRLEQKIKDYLYIRNNVAKRITGYLRQVPGNRTITEHEVRKACEIMESRGELVCIAKSKGPRKHKVYGLDISERIKIGVAKGDIIVRDEEE
jgi:hypothetical protein